MRIFKKIMWWFLALLMMIIIFRFSSEKASDSADTSKGIVSLIIDFLPFVKNMTEHAKQEFISVMDFTVRKCAHFTLYAILGFVTYGAVNSTFSLKQKNYAKYSFAMCLLYAISDEIHQYFVPGRACRLYDVAIDSAGAIFGIFLFCLITRTLKKAK